MKTTGIVRGIDSLGRIVLPKELRTNMHIDKDSKLEIFVESAWPSMRVTASAPPAGQRSLPCKRKRRIT